MASTHGIVIDGEWTDAAGGETSDVYNPADRGDHAGSYQRATEGDARRAVAAAVDAQSDWAATTGAERGAVLTEAARLIEDRLDGMTETLLREEGKTWSGAAGRTPRVKPSGEQGEAGIDFFTISKAVYENY